jgi:hypothetical protein
MPAIQEQAKATADPSASLREDKQKGWRRQEQKQFLRDEKQKDR